MSWKVDACKPLAQGIPDVICVGLRRASRVRAYLFIHLLLGDRETLRVFLCCASVRV
jgi:hypothetical protein